MLAVLAIPCHILLNNKLKKQIFKHWSCDQQGSCTNVELPINLPIKYKVHAGFTLTVIVFTYVFFFFYSC